MKDIKFHPRKCDITGEGMSSGYLIGEGLMYIKYESDMIKHLRDVEKEGNADYDKLVAEGRLTDEFLLNDYYESDYYYYTDWECPNDIQYVEIDGVMYEEGDSMFDLAITEKKVTPNNDIYYRLEFLDSGDGVEFEYWRDSETEFVYRVPIEIVRDFDEMTKINIG